MARTGRLGSYLLLKGDPFSISLFTAEGVILFSMTFVFRALLDAEGGSNVTNMVNHSGSEIIVHSESNSTLRSFEEGVLLEPFPTSESKTTGTGEPSLKELYARLEDLTRSGIQSATFWDLKSRMLRGRELGYITR